jgi:glycosidase
MLWGDGDTIQNPEGATYGDRAQIKTTVKDQLKDEKSVLRHYSNLIAIRHKYPAIARGDYNAVTSEMKNFGGFYIEYNGEVFGLFHNTSKEQITINLSQLDGLDGHNFAKLCDSIGAGGAKLNGDKLTIDGQTSVILGK